MSRVVYLVPARKGSLGFPGKNAVLLPVLWKMFQNGGGVLERVVLSTDDDSYGAGAPEYVQVIERPPELANADAGMDDVMRHAANHLNLDGDMILVTLYPTYVDRTLDDILSVLSFMAARGAEHVLCAKPLDTSPYLSFQWLDDCKAKPAIDHSYYRRQDYPACFETSHLVIATRVGYLSQLNHRLYTPDTMFYQLDRKPIDVDRFEDFKEWARTCE